MAQLDFYTYIRAGLTAKMNHNVWHDVFAPFYFHNMSSIINHPCPRNWSFRWDSVQLQWAITFRTSMTRPLAFLNFCNIVFTLTMPASPPLAMCILSNVQASVLVMKSFLRGNLALADSRLISLVHPLRIFHTFFPNESRQKRINVGPWNCWWQMQPFPQNS